MGLIRGGLLSFATLLLFLSLLAGNVFLTLNLSLSSSALKESVSSNYGEIIKSFGGGNDEFRKTVGERMGEMQDYCKNNTEYVFSDSRSGYAIDISCGTVLQGEEAVVKEGLSDIVDGIYSKEYTCRTPFKCVLDEKQALFLFSKQANDYWKKWAYYFIAISLLLIVAIFFLVESKENALIISGTLAALSSLPFIVISRIFSMIEGPVPLLSLVPILLSKSHAVFLIMLSAGIILLALGIALKFFSLWEFLADKFGNKPNKGRKR
jgi:hypothetical protein